MEAENLGLEIVFGGSWRCRAFIAGEFKIQHDASFAYTKSQQRQREARENSGDPARNSQLIGISAH